MVFCLLLKLGKNTGKSISKNLNGKCRQKLLDHAKQSPTDAKKKRAIQKTAKATGYLIGSKIADKITRVSKKSRQNNSETVTNVRDKKIYSQRETKNY